MGSVTVACVQLDFQPCIVQFIPFLEEPSLLEEGEQGITSLHPTSPELNDRFNALRQQIAEAHIAFMKQRIAPILRKMDEQQVDIVIFPEYSIPASCLSEIQKYAGNCSVIAGSHTVTTKTIPECVPLGLQLNTSDVGKSISPILLNKVGWQWVDKLSKSRWEPLLKPGTLWKPFTFHTREGNELTFAVLLCVDFINENDDNVQKCVPRQLWNVVDFGVVPAYSPTLKDFEQRAHAIAERAGRPIIYANVASRGGSRVYCRFDSADAFTSHNGTKPLAAGDEAIVIVRMPVGGYSQFRPTPTALPTPLASTIVSMLPILPAARFATFINLKDALRSASDHHKIMSLLHTSEKELISLTSGTDTPTVLRAKIFALLDAMTWRDVEWLNNYLDCIVLNERDSILAEKTFALLYKAQDVLSETVKDSRLSGDLLDAITEALSVYRRKLDRLRNRMPADILQRFESVDKAVHVVANASADEFTSVFLMRLRSARVHRDSLEMQIRLISTIAYRGNKNLALTLRYVSLPNPGGNLKELEIQVIGAARSDDRKRARSLADNFRRDLANLMRVTLREAYLLELKELDLSELSKATEPFDFTNVVELRRKIDFGTQPYLDIKSAPRFHHLEGSSTMARILDSLQSHPAACLVSIHLHPVSLDEHEEAFFKAYRRSAEYQEEENQAAMFYLGTERHYALRLDDAKTIRRMLGNTEGLLPTVLVRLFIASDEPISRLLVNTIGNELWGNDSYEICSFDDVEHRAAVCQTIRQAWATSEPGYKAPEKLERVPFLFDPYEASRIFRLPLEGYSGAVGKLSMVIQAPAAVLPDEGVEIGHGFHAGAQKPIVVRLSDKERTKHVYVIGKTGTGKSTLLGRMIEQDIQRGKGVCVIDPHGDLVDSILTKIPDIRKSDVVWFDPANTERPFGLNLLEFNPNARHHKDFVVQETISIMRKLVYFEHTGPVFEHNLRNLVLTMLDPSMNGEGTLLEVPRLLYDKDFRDSVIPRLEDELVRDFWKQYKQLGSNTLSENLWYVVSKFDTFTIDRIIRNIIGQSRSTINIPDIIQNRKILLVKLPSAMTGELNSALLGMILISKLRWAAMARSSLRPEERSDYYVYVDEFQNFAAAGFESVLAEARKYQLGLVLAHQHIGQLSAFNIATGQIEDRAARAVFGNAGTMIVFRVGLNDAKALAGEMGSPLDPDNPEDLENLRNYYAIVKTLIDGEVYPPFTVKTLLPTTPENAAIANAIRQESLEKYGTPAVQVEEAIRERARRMMEGSDGASAASGK